MLNVRPAVRSIPLSFSRNAPGAPTPTEARRVPALPPSSAGAPAALAALQPPLAAGFALRPGVKLNLERQLTALESTPEFRAMTATPEFEAYGAAFQADAVITKKLSGLVATFADLYKTDAFTAFRLTRQARALHDTLSRCEAEGCTTEQEALIDNSVTLSLFKYDWLIRAAKELAEGEQYP